MSDHRPSSPARRSPSTSPRRPSRLEPVRGEPREDAEQVTEVLAGEPLVVERLDGEWARIKTAYDYPGWIRAEALEDGEGVLPAPRDGEPLDEARHYLGSRYLWGGLTEAGIDCSGLVHMAHRRLGRLVPRDADQQEEAGAEVPEADARPGDLVTYGDDQADHVAFWLGGGRVLHSTDREGVHAVVEEEEPAAYRVRRRKIVRL